MHIKNYSQIVAQEIKKLRISKKISVQELAKKSQVPKSTIYRVETGNHDFRLIKIYKLCIALEIKFTDFLKITDAEYEKQKRHP